MVMARMETTRDLLMLPNPLHTEDGWRRHYKNKDLCCMHFFWEYVWNIPLN